MAVLLYNFKSFKFESEADAYAWWSAMADPAVPTRWYARVDSGWWGVAIDTNPIDTPPNIVDLAMDRTGVELEDWEPPERIPEREGTSTETRVVFLCGPQTHLNARLGQFFSVDQHKTANITDVHLDLITPKPPEKRILLQGLKYVTHLTIKSGMERNAFEQLVPANGAEWVTKDVNGDYAGVASDVAALTLDYRHVKGKAGPLEMQVRFTYWAIDGSVYHQTAWSDVAPEYDLDASFEKGVKRRGRVLGAVQSCVYRACMTYANVMFASGTPVQATDPSDGVTKDVDPSDDTMMEMYFVEQMTYALGVASALLAANTNNLLTDAQAAYEQKNRQELLLTVSSSTALPDADFGWLAIDVDHVLGTRTCRQAMITELTPLKKGADGFVEWPT